MGLRFFISLLVTSLCLCACGSTHNARERALRDSLFKDDSLLALYVMEKLKPRIIDSMQGDTIRVREAIKEKWDFPRLSPESRKNLPKPLALDSCGDPVVEKTNDSLSVLEGSKKLVSPASPSTKSTLPTKPNAVLPKPLLPKPAMNAPAKAPIQNNIPAPVTNSKHTNYEIKGNVPLPVKPTETPKPAAETPKAEPPKAQDKVAIKVLE